MTIIFNKELEILSKEREEGNMRKEEEEMNKVVANFNMTFNAISK